MRSAGRSDFVRILPWVVCLALGAAAHLLWALDAWFHPRPRAPVTPIVVHVIPPPAVAPATVVVRDRVVRVRRTESPAASDPELLRMLVDRHVRCDRSDTCTIDPRLVSYLLAPPGGKPHSTGRRTAVTRDGRPRAMATSASPYR